jgi:cyclopropane fatty-acyl-phospholipid synthase-like methyltransferase
MTVKTEWADFFNGHAPIYDDNDFTKNTAAEVEFLVETLGLAPGASILDVGCGTGRHSVELAKRGFHITGLDISEGMLDQAKKRAADANVQINWILSNAADFKLDRLFDAVICLCEGAFGLLGSQDDPISQPLAVLRNISRSLKPDAPCLFTVLNGYKLARQHTPDDVATGKFNPFDLTELSDCPKPENGSMRERGFVPTELVFLFGLSGLGVEHLWGGTAGNWGKRGIELDEYEIMIVARKTTDPVVLQDGLINLIRTE